VVKGTMINSSSISKSAPNRARATAVRSLRSSGGLERSPEPPALPGYPDLRLMDATEVVVENGKPAFRDNEHKGSHSPHEKKSHLSPKKAPQPKHRTVSKDEPAAAKFVSPRVHLEKEMDTSTLHEMKQERFEREAEADRLAAEYEIHKLVEDSGMGTKAAEVARAMRLDVHAMDRRRQVLHIWISWSGFDTFIGLVIMMNALTIGLETNAKANIPIGCSMTCECDEGVEGCQLPPEWLEFTDYAFFGVYLIEFLLRFYTYGFPVLRSHWVKFDLFLVSTSFLDILLKQLAVQNEILNQVMLVRMLRLARLARAVRLMVQFQTLWQLVQGLMHSIGTLMWTFLLVMILVYIFAIIGIEFITIDEKLPADDPYNIVATDNFRSFPDAIMTLLQVLTLDSIGSIYRPLIKHRFYLFFYFIGVMLLLSIALMNLVTAVMVNSSLDQASEDKDAKKAWEAAKKKKQMEALRLMFIDLDEDESGALTLDEINAAPEAIREELQEIAGTDDITALFEMLDYDGGGSIDTNEFCEGVIRATNSDKPVELGRLVKQCSDILSNSRRLVDCVSGTLLEGSDTERDGGVEARLQNMEGKMKAMQQDMARVVKAVLSNSK